MSTDRDFRTKNGQRLPMPLLARQLNAVYITSAPAQFICFRLLLFSCSVAQSCLTLCDPWTAACRASLSFAVSQSLLKLMSVELVMPSNQFILCHPLPSCLQSFPALPSFLMSRLFASGGQSIGASASASVLPKNIKGGSPLGLTGLISLQIKGLLRVFSSTII